MSQPVAVASQEAICEHQHYLAILSVRLATMQTYKTLHVFNAQLTASYATLFLVCGVAPEAQQLEDVLM
jgi:hypothetical protein